MQKNMHKKQSLLVQLVDIFLIEITNWRWSWRAMVITGTIVPLISLTGLGAFARDSGKTALEYVLVGNIVLSLMFGIMNNIEGHFVFMRFQGMLDYFATLPIKRPILILSLVAAFLCIALPSLLITIIAGSFLLGIHLTINPLIILVMPLCAMSVSGIGALIGVHARTPEEAGAISLLINMLLMSIGPVVIPPDHLSAILLFLGHFSPTTYAASALRQVLIGPVTGELAIDIAVLVGVTIVIFWLVGRNMSWRRVS